MGSEIPVVDRSPEDVTSDTKHHYSEDSDDDKDGDEDESSEEGDEAESSPSYEGPKEPRTKEQHNLSGKEGGAQQSTASGRTTHSFERARTKVESSAEKQPKPPKQISSKPCKAMVPRIKLAVPVV